MLLSVVRLPLAVLSWVSVAVAQLLEPGVIGVYFFVVARESVCGLPFVVVFDVSVGLVSLCV